MTPSEYKQALLRVQLRVICDSLNPGGQTKLARMIGRSPRTIRRKLAGKSRITESDALAIQKAVETAEGR